MSKRQYSMKLIKKLTKSQLRIYMLNTAREKFGTNFEDCPIACYLTDTYNVVSAWVSGESIDLTLYAEEKHLSGKHGTVFDLHYRGKVIPTVTQEIDLSKWQRKLIASYGNYGKSVTKAEVLNLLA